MVDLSTRKRIVLVGSALVAMLLLGDAFVAPPVHAVHSPGAMDVNVTTIGPDRSVIWLPGRPTETLAEVKCDPGSPTGRVGGCDPTAAANALNMRQTDHTLYLVWSGCAEWTGAGEVIPWQGHNIEYLASSRTLVFHCYVAKPWVYQPERLYGSIAVPFNVLVAIPTSSMGAGQLTIEEDDRLEHLVGDQSTETHLATTTIA